MIEDIVHDALGLSPVAESMAKYELDSGQRPAIFYQNSAPDTRKEWAGIQYPRMVHQIDWQYDVQRKTSGVLAIDIFCINESEYIPEDLGKQLSESFSNSLFTDESGTYCVVWKNSASFIDTSSKEPQIIGVTVNFDIWAFPPTLTGITPDPVECVMRFIKDMQPDCKIMGTDTLQEIDRGENDKPAVYVRSISESSAMRNTWATQWYDSIIGIHIMAESPSAREAWAKKIVHDISREKNYFMNDGSTMRFISMAITYAANPLQQGQIALTVQYAVRTAAPNSNLMNHININ